ncbi:MAG TPA: hypothetical protein VF735_22520 [Pyrinomonadaceae bacterium]
MPAVTAHAQEAGGGSGVVGQPVIVSLPGGGHVAFRVKTTTLNVSAGQTPGGADLSLPLATQAQLGEGNVVHRLLVDGHGNIVFGYDLVVDAITATHTFRVTARPLDKLFESRFSARREGASVNSQTPFNVNTLALSTGEHTVEDGETFALDLLINDRLGLKVVDYVKVATDKSRLQLAPMTPVPARDFAVANVELAVSNYQLKVDGTPLRTASVRRSCAGSLLWFALPEQGRFIFSLAPHAGYGFEKVGVIEDNKIVFSWKGVRYEWISGAPIVGSGGVWNLWVLHDPTYVDGFQSPGDKRKGESRLEQVLTDPLGSLAERIGDPRRSSDLQTREPRAAQQKERVRVRIGGASSIESLLPKN